MRGEERSHLLDETRKDEPLEARVHSRKPLKLRHDLRRHMHRAEERCQEGIAPQKTEVQKDGGVRHDDHRESRKRMASRS